MVSILLSTFSLSLLLIQVAHSEDFLHTEPILNDGDLMLGGLFPVHEMGTEKDCSELINERGVQRVEAMLWAIDRINADNTLLPGIKLGFMIHDTCMNGFHALKDSLDFIDLSLSDVNIKN